MTLFADRYGSTTGFARHGGSGRAALSGCFQAKGIGQTPLVGCNVPAGHSHGCMSLAEAIREAIYGEVVDAEFPHGAVPTVAIIGTQLRYSSPDPADEYDQDVRRAIAIRPSAIRLAHAQRAPLFKKSITGFVNRQADDAARTGEVIERWLDSASVEGAISRDADRLRSVMRALVEQIAFGQIHRLFCGGYFSSNITISGALLDFGNMHALPNWARAQVHSVVEGFGAEMQLLKGVATSLAFYVTKYLRRGEALRLGEDLYCAGVEHYRIAWRTCGASLFGGQRLPGKARDALANSLWRYYEDQQRCRVNYRFGVATTTSTSAPDAWLYDSIIAEGECKPCNREGELLGDLARTLRSCLPFNQRTTAWYTAARTLRPRESIYRRKLLEELAVLTSPRAEDGGLASAIKHYVRNAINSARRHWQRLPTTLSVLAHTTYDGSSALLVREEGEDKQYVWLEGPAVSGESLQWFDETLSSEEGAALSVVRHGAYWTALVQSHERDGKRYVQLPTREIYVPAMAVRYDPPGTQWYL